MKDKLVNTDCYQNLFNHLANEHDLTLTESEMDEIIRHSLNTVSCIDSMRKEIKEFEFIYSEESYVNEMLGLVDSVGFFTSKKETIEEAIDDFLTEVDTKRVYLDEEVAIHYEDDTIEFEQIEVKYDFDGSANVIYNNKTYYGYGQTRENNK